MTIWADSEAILVVISGGQTGVDRAALDVAIELNLPCGGWCPAERKAEDGRINDCYPLTETTSQSYSLRTEWNVRDSDATLLVTHGEPTGGTSLTLEFTQRLERPCLLVDLQSGWQEIDAARVRMWIEEERVRVLNIAGPRESTIPGIYRIAFDFLRFVLLRFSADQRYLR